MRGAFGSATVEGSGHEVAGSFVFEVQDELAVEHEEKEFTGRDEEDEGGEEGELFVGPGVHPGVCVGGSAVDEGVPGEGEAQGGEAEHDGAEWAEVAATRVAEEFDGDDGSEDEGGEIVDDHARDDGVN